MVATVLGTNRTKREHYAALKATLWTERQTHLDPLYTELGDFIAPHRVRFVTTERNSSNKRRAKIINPAASLAARTLRAGMMSGITSPARPWFRLSTPDLALNEYGPVKLWLTTVSARMREVFLRSNFYNALSTAYLDIGVFGTSAMIMVEDFKDVLRCYTFPIGAYALAANERQVVDTLVRQYQATVRQLVLEFGEYDPRTGRPNWHRFSTTIKDLWDRGSYETPVDVLHVVGPNLEERRSALAKFKPFASCYYEVGNGNREASLRESGFDEFPVLAPRWDRTGEDVYGSTCPGIEARGDAKALQTLEKLKAQGIEKQVKPPLTAPASLQNQKVSQIAGDVTFVDVREGQQGLRPVHEVNLRVDHVGAEIREHETRISRTFYEDLFLMLARSDRREITAREIDERHEEKLLALGPVLENLNDDQLDPAIDRAFAIMYRFGMIPPPPPELEQMPLKVEYISIMAQAQKLVGLAGLERFVMFVGGQLIPIRPDAADKVDIDQIIDEYADITGVAPAIVVPDERVAQIRQQRAQQQQAAAKVAELEQTASATKLLGDTSLEGDNALTRMIRNAGGV